MNTDDQGSSADGAIDAETVQEWTEPFEDWYYYPDHVVQPEPDIEGYEDVSKTDIPTVYRIPGEDGWYMSVIGFNGTGYQSFVFESDDLVTWSNPQLGLGFGPDGVFDHGGVTLGAYVYESYDIDSPRTLKSIDGSYWSLYGAYPRQGEYEPRPGYQGLARSDDGVTWHRASDDPILSVHQDDCGMWEQSCIYQPWLVEHDGQFYDFYNAANKSIEQTGLALSEDLRSWERYEGNPIVETGPDGSFNDQFSSDPKVYWDDDHWVMFFFGVGRDGAHIMIAFSEDLRNWTVNSEPLYEAGGHPNGLDNRFAHKTSLVYNPENEIYYMFYNAVGDRGRGIGLLTSEPLPDITYSRN